MSKDQVIGGAILAVCLIIAVGYTALLVFPGEVSSFVGLNMNSNTLRLYAVMIPVFVAFIAILAIGVWIGWTMATTPPPKPIEETTTT